jgi:hypothetical protein
VGKNKIFMGRKTKNKNKKFYYKITHKKKVQQLIKQPH